MPADPPSDHGSDSNRTFSLGASSETWSEGLTGASTAPSHARYTDFRPLGRGSLGEVFLVHDRTLGRDVAYKRLSRADDAGARRRFEREAQLTARLGHPGVVPVHDRGHDSEGRPFYTMKAIAGRSMAEALAEASDLPARLQLLDVLIAVVDAVSAAHATGVVHRDLKPANVMIGAFGETLVVDWGLARALDAHDSVERTDRDANPSETREGTVMGTPLYMPPEQARGERGDARADVWALGAMLYKLLTGRAPHEGGRAVDVIARAATEPVSPVLSRSPDAPAELAAVAERALALLPEQRYPSAQALGADLRAFRQGRRVAAYAYSSRELLQRTFNQYRVPILVGVAGLSLALTALGWGLSSTLRERDLAVTAREQAEQSEAEAQRSLSELLAQQARALQEHEPDDAEALAWRALALQEGPIARGVIVRNTLRWRPSLRWHADLPRDCTSKASTHEHYLCVEAGVLSRWRLSDGQREPVTRPAARVFGAKDAEVYYSDGERVFRYDPATDQAVPGPPELQAELGNSSTIRFAPTHHWVTAIGKVRRITGDQVAPPVQVFPAPSLIRTLTNAPDGGVYLISETGELAYLSPALTLEETPITRAAAAELVSDLTVLRDGTAILLFRQLGLLFLSPSGERLRTVPMPAGEDNLRALSASDDGRRLLVTSGLGRSYLWDAAIGAWVGSLTGQLQEAHWATLSPSGEQAWLRSPTEMVQLALPSASGDVHPTHGGLAAVSASATGAQFAWTNGSSQWGLADASAPTTPHPFDPPLSGSPKDIVLTRDGALIIGHTRTGILGPERISARPEPAVPYAITAVRRLQWADNHRALVSLDYGYGLSYFTTDGGMLRLAFSEPFPTGEFGAIDLAVDDTRHIAYVTDPSKFLIHRVDLASRNLLTPLNTSPEAGLAIAVNPVNGLLAIGTENNALLLLHPDGKPLRTLFPHPAPIMSLAFSNDGTLLATACRDGIVRLLRVSDGALLAELYGHRHWVSDLVFSADDTQLASASWDETLRIWDLSRLYTAPPESP